MSKKSKANKSTGSKPEPNKLQGLESLVVFTALDPEPEVVAAISNALQSLPQFAILQDAIGMQQEVDELDAEEDRILGGETLSQIKERISTLQGKVAQFRVVVKNAVLNTDGINFVKEKILSAKLPFAAELEKIVDAEVQRSAKFVGWQEELAEALKKATRAQEIRQKADKLEKESQSLLASIQITK